MERDPNSGRTPDGIPAVGPMDGENDRRRPQHQNERGTTSTAEVDADRIGGRDDGAVSLSGGSPLAAVRVNGIDAQAQRRRAPGDRRDPCHEALPSPRSLSQRVLATAEAVATAERGRREAAAALSRCDGRLLAVVGPCSVHDPDEAIEYAQRLRAVSEQLGDALVVVMRVYVEKPRTTVGWKGLVYDPRLDGTCDLAQGLEASRRLLADVNALGVPAAVEFLSPLLVNYLEDLVSWGAVGARTAESQVHRELASGVSAPVGFKNATCGDVGVALDGILAATSPHVFPCVAGDGVSVARTEGNPHCHLVLRGSTVGPNHDAASVAAAAALSRSRGIDPAIVVDCSHGNCGKQHARQVDAAASVARQVAAGCEDIRGFMLESNLCEGRQDIPVATAGESEGESGGAGGGGGRGMGTNARPALLRGVSVTDPCLGWESTVEVLRAMADASRARIALRNKENRTD